MLWDPTSGGFSSKEFGDTGNGNLCKWWKEPAVSDIFHGTGNRTVDFCLSEGFKTAVEMVFQRISQWLVDNIHGGDLMTVAMFAGKKGNLGERREVNKDEPII